MGRTGTRVSGAWPTVLRARRPGRFAAVSARAASAGSLPDSVSTVESPVATGRASASESRPCRGHFIDGRPIALGRVRSPGGYRSGLVGEVTRCLLGWAKIFRTVVGKFDGERRQTRKGERTREKGDRQLQHCSSPCLFHSWPAGERQIGAANPQNPLVRIEAGPGCSRESIAAPRCFTTRLLASRPAFDHA